MMETVNLLDKSYEVAMPYGKQEDNGKLEQRDRRMARTETSEPYTIHDGITVTMIRMAQAPNVDVCRNRTARFVS